MQQPSIEVIQKAQTDKEAFGSLLDTSLPLARHWCRQLCDNHHDMEDILQEVCIKLYRDIIQLRQPERFNGWFKQLVMHTAYDWFRKHKRKLEMEDIENAFDLPEANANTVEQSTENSELGEYLKSSIDRLSENNRIVFTLFYEQGKKITDIASLLGLTETTVKNRLSRARDYLRRDLAPVLDKTYIDLEKAFNILILSCSHSKQGFSYQVASTAGEAILKASPKSQYRILELADFELSGCKTCGQCSITGQCIIDDDFNLLFDQCRSSDAILFSVPYYAPIPSKLSALLERLMSVSIQPVIASNNPGRGFPLQGKWCGVLSFSIVRRQNYLAGVIREPLVSLGMGLILTEYALPCEASISDHAALLGRLAVERLLETPNSNAIDNWFDFWSEENQKVFEKMHQNELNRLKMGQSTLP